MERIGRPAYDRTIGRFRTRNISSLGGPPILVVYNASGIIFLLTSLLIGLPVAAMSGRVWLGLATVALSWIGMGVWWRNRLREDGRKRPFPSLFFVPLPILSVPLLLLSLSRLPRGVEEATRDRTTRDL